MDERTRRWRGERFMVKKTKELTVDDFIVKLDKQAWEVREVMEKDLGIDRMTKLEELKDKAEDMVRKLVEGDGNFIMYYSWLEAIMWMREEVDNMKSERGK